MDNKRIKCRQNSLPEKAAEVEKGRCPLPATSINQATFTAFDRSAGGVTLSPITPPDGRFTLFD